MRTTSRGGRSLGIGAAAASLVLLAGACGSGEGVATGPQDEGGDTAKQISIGLIPWEEDIAVTNLWKVILEEKGYEVEVQSVDVAPVYQGVAQGDIDLYLDTWLPTTHADYWEQYGDDMEDLGVWYDNASLKLTVPSYVEDVDSIEDLKGRADEFGGEIIGIESGSGLVRTTKESAMPEYGLDEEYNLVESSTSAMLAELDAAIQEERPIVVTLWRPHIAYAKYDLKDLEDPAGAMGEREEIHMVGRSGFAEDFPELNGWLQNFTLSDEQLADLEQVVLEDHKGDEEAGARAWLADNPDFLPEVLGEDAEGLEF
ncbi:glycine betaine ABC transporter substrate-binding protein [Marinactinospora thermotolerans]|uniref:Glycine betaine/proline transport system substrate-binding protein n=1 Tax=Marinactinospora thermotolerans DSM 45154 TaxID=1122192 RepID=A0A1T4R3F6_9ACTN|nr:glycine betaine ABC transporter substrate-binding protein [Marinactinospora thermotolerans]SKA10499.1 glycine betaine/proline transport system substrate-binding protein [Marinactinospora thermotolerans DSM 45154]